VNVKPVWKVVGIALALWGSNASAQAYPNKPLKTVVPYPAGGYYDMMARTMSQKLSGYLGQPVVVENRAGANGIIGTEFVAKSAPDGYTVMVGGIGPHGINPGLYAKLPYDAVKDFAPILHVASQPNILVVPASSKLNSVKELIDAARARPGHITYASNGAGSSQHLSAVLFAITMKLELSHIPYKGGGPALAGMLGAQADHLFGGPAEMLPHIRAGKLRPLAVTSEKRIPAVPNVPTMIEAGVPNYEISAWFGFLAPAGTPKDIVQKLNTELNKSMREPDVKDALEAQGSVELIGGTPEHFANFIKTEIVKWTKIVKDSGATVN
jgi:tripartite-type tricarboxylate transporter receptor subunit TctC